MNDDEAIGTGADRCLLEAIVADLGHVLARHDPGGTADAGIEGEKVGPRLLQPEPHVLRIRRLDRGDTLLEQALAGTPIALERELHIVRRDGLAVVECGALAQDELIGEAVLRRGKRLGEARRLIVARHRLHQCVVHPIEEHVRRDDPAGLARVEPGRGERHVHAIRQLPLRSGDGASLASRDADRRERKQGSSRHGSTAVVQARPITPPCACAHRRLPSCSLNGELHSA